MNKLKKTVKLVQRFIKREPNLFFHSPTTAFNAALAESYSHNKINNNSKKIATYIGIDKHLMEGISIFEEVISFPLQKGKEKDYYGGLINSITRELISEAILDASGVPYQEFLAFENQDIFSKEIPTIEQPILFGGILFNHFGHFLLESINRLWAYEFVKNIDPYICFYAPWGIPNYLEKDNYVNQVLTGFKIPHKKLIFINDLIRLKEVIVPRQKYGFGYINNPDSIFINFINSFRFKTYTPKGFKNAEKIYVSRSKMPLNAGRPIAEYIFEEYLISNGYKILYPELYTLFQQLTIYSQAKKIIFCDGSAIHGCILLPNLQADVAIISRRKDPRWDCSWVIGQFQGYGKDVLWVDAVRGQYQFGLESWDALSDIDWYKVSIVLEQQGFVDGLFNNFNQLDHEQIAINDIANYIQTISINPQFIDFMMKFKE